MHNNKTMAKPVNSYSVRNPAKPPQNVNLTNVKSPNNGIWAGQKIQLPKIFLRMKLYTQKIVISKIQEIRSGKLLKKLENF